VNRVVPADALLEEANAMAREMLSNPPLALREVKKSLYAGDVPLADALRWESAGNAATSGTEDRQEANRSFVERRTPVFKGR
jgi:enoyl-CoA hydratase/carnithine racemase